MTTETPEPTGGSDGAPLSAVEPAPPGSNLADRIDAMEDRVLHGEEEAAQEAKEETDAEEEAPEPEDVDPSAGTPV
ncbi:hypothetical protein NF556_01900 [Ornithinimicrobium faecis]|uniref:Uncharacterized protein n=1 Tax=Ornithinimicrobium faecis TaxID=2934158 RepID=A0ABY4YUJ1_9MICO|nr:hypothetical protein [Ornithinimicrobium sp. HY1793]USQ80443.1 hypothetical protein NF556_01900 [Ornithinimicrobium sp. HY1793]